MPRPLSQKDVWAKGAGKGAKVVGERKQPAPKPDPNAEVVGLLKRLVAALEKEKAPVVNVPTPIVTAPEVKVNVERPAGSFDIEATNGKTTWHLKIKRMGEDKK